MRIFLLTVLFAAATYSTTSHVAFATRKRLLAGWLAGEGLLPLVDLDVELASNTHSRVRGVGDLTLGFGLQWAPKRLGTADSSTVQ